MCKFMFNQIIEKEGFDNYWLEPDLVNAMQKSSIISSFFMGKLSIAINSLIFPLRYNDAVSSYLITKNSQIRKDTLKTFGKILYAVKSA